MDLIQQVMELKLSNTMYKMKKINTLIKVDFCNIITVLLFLIMCICSNNTAKASEVTGTLNSGSSISTGISGTVVSPVVPVAPATPTYSGGGGGGSSASTAIVNSPVNVTQVSVYTFAKTLKSGDSNSDVLKLQKFLNENNYKIATGGAGSPGRETNSFGTLTKKALMKFQKDKGLSQTGILDTKTISKIKEVSTTTTSTQAVTPSGNTSLTTENIAKEVVRDHSFTQDLKKGDTNADVKALQIYLNSNGFKIAKNGVGSPGKESNSFGDLTRKALMQFQKTNNIPATGYFGPTTRAYLNK